ncbi:hypothetical protein FB451DRAFT_1265217 [Mycena latifolia]|nr:hypothetical protein FB451DRAFT_1265217 [Mycena latifolia]
METTIETSRAILNFLDDTSKVLWLLTRMRNVLDWERIRDQIGSLTSEATIATFLAAAQSQVITLSYQDNSTGVKVATNVLGFAGVLLDVITAFLALLSSTILQRHIGIDAFLQQLAEMAHVLNIAELPPDIFRHLYKKIRQRGKALNPNSNSPQKETNIDMLESRPGESARLNIALIAESVRHIQSAAFIGDAAGTAMLWGILCFFASVQCLALSTQPPVVWIVSAVICSFVIVLPVANRVLGLIGIRLPSVFDI